MIVFRRGTSGEGSVGGLEIRCPWPRAWPLIGAVDNLSTSRSGLRSRRFHVSWQSEYGQH
jgi:hypothetical protein